MLILEIERRAGDHPHAILWLGDASGRLPSAPFWSADQGRLVGLRRGDVVAVRGRITSWRDRRQLAIDSLQVLPGERAPWEDLLPSIGDRAPWWSRLDAWRCGLGSPRLRAALAIFFDDRDFRHRFGECPASTSGHHAKLGGLLQHSCEVAHLALTLARATPAADPDLLLAGALLHDIGKLDSYRWDGPFETTVTGHVLGHVVLGCLRFDRAVGTAPNPPLTPSELILLQHLILSHHGRAEFGAPVRPMTLEAEILHYADDASARTDAMASALADPGLFPDGAEVSVRPLWQLDQRRVWRGRSAWGRS
ncbi:MAG TPA: HD domain-containing protein [Gemmatimonadales bacterium]|nr:HD domain-containing protein [Gemmatimonadales bacterium]